jgi:hypothetical protein
MISKDQFDAVKERIYNEDPEMTDLALASGLDIPTHNGRVEENFSSYLIQNTLLGKPFRWSEQAANGAMLSMRMRMFATTVRSMESGGAPISLAEAKQLARHINTLTGRGDVGSKAEGLSVILLAPRYAKSRLDLIFGSYRLLRNIDGMTPRVKMEVGRGLAQYYAAVGVAALAAQMAGAEVETDPRSADFLKAKIKTPNGEIVFDLTGGAGGYVKMATRLALSLLNSGNEDPKIPSDKQPDKEVNRDPWSQGVREWAGKAAPVPGAVAVGGGALKDRGGKPRNIIGQPTDMRREFTRLLGPIQIQSLIQNIREGGDAGEIATSFIAEFLGVGANFRGSADENYDVMAVYDKDPAAGFLLWLNATAKGEKLTPEQRGLTSRGNKGASKTEEPKAPRKTRAERRREAGLE